MTPLRQKMTEEMQMRGYAPSTIEGYVHSVAQLARHYHRSPDKLEEEEVRRYLLHLTLEKKIARGSFSVVLGGLRFFYHKTLCREWKSPERVPGEKETKTSPAHRHLPALCISAPDEFMTSVSVVAS